MPSAFSAVVTFGQNGSGIHSGPQLDEAGNEPNIENGKPKMTTPTKDEISAKLEAAEARTEARIATLSGSIDVRFVGLDHKLDRIVDSLSGLVVKVDEVKQDNKNTRWTIAGIFVGATLAALAALWVTQGNQLASFQAGLTALQMKTDAGKADPSAKSGAEKSSADTKK